MNVVGLVVEYNPLHNGHLYHYLKSKEVTNADAVVIVMSGNFLQRGEPALVNKWARTQMALDMGVDLVIELPYVYSTAQAQHFAFGAVSLLHQLRFVTHICFGSESGHIDDIKTVAEKLWQEPQSFQAHLKQYIQEGVSYPRAYGQALKHLLLHENLDPTLFERPNNILGLHYIMALHRLNSTIQPSTIKREKADYHQQNVTDTQIASATALRKLLFETDTPQWDNIEPFVPNTTLNVLKDEYNRGRGPVNWEHYFDYVRHLLIAQSVDQLQQIYEMEEGIEYRFKQVAMQATSILNLIEGVKSKRYTWNRIQRMILHTFTQYDKASSQLLNLDKGPSYLRLLGFSEKGRQLLNKYKKQLTIPLITQIKKNHPAMLSWDIQASRLHALAYDSNIRLDAIHREIKQTPLRRGETY